MAYINRTQVEAFLTPEAVFNIYNDNNLGRVNTEAFNANAQLASSITDSYVARAYGGPFPLTQNPLPQNVTHAALLWMKALSFERHPEYVRMYGTGPRKVAEEFCERLADAEMFLPDLVQQPIPGTAGGVFVDDGHRMLTSDPDGTDNSGDWG